jgi:hypothetical protein
MFSAFDAGISSLPKGFLNIQYVQNRIEQASASSRASPLGPHAKTERITIPGERLRASKTSGDRRDLSLFLAFWLGRMPCQELSGVRFFALGDLFGRSLCDDLPAVRHVIAAGDMTEMRSEAEHLGSCTQTAGGRRWLVDRVAGMNGS